MLATKLVLSIAICLSSFSFTGLQAEASNALDSEYNLALQKKGTASSLEGTAGRDERAAFDGDKATRWASASGMDGSGIDESWMYVDLESQQDINKIILRWESRPNKFKLQVSNNAIDWSDITDIIDNGWYTAAPASHTNTIQLDETVNARYIRMQGIKRRCAENGNNRTGYSLYEFEVYGPVWNDEDFIREYMKTLTVQKNVTKDFNLPINNDTYGVTLEWSSNNDAIDIDEAGHARVTREVYDQVVELTASIHRGEVFHTKTFYVSVKAMQNDEYTLSPLPRNITYGDETLHIDSDINLVFEEGVAPLTQENYTDALKQANHSYTISDQIKDDTTNIIVGLKDGTGIVDEYFDSFKYDESISSDVEEGYVLNVDTNQDMIAILGNDNAGMKYGSYTLSDILKQGVKEVKELLIEDSPQVMFRGFIEGFYGTPWSHENRKSLMEFGGHNKMNTYIYGPKNDDYHTSKWREPYPANKLAELQELVNTGKKTGVEFVWAAHVGGKINLTNEQDIQALKDKFDQMYGIGVRQFAIFFDDSATNNTELVTFMNRMQREYIDTFDDVKPLIFCPQYYNKKNGNESYLRNLQNFDERIQIMWTGDFVVSEINQPVIDYIVNLIDRPVYIWWNYPVNDLGRSGMMHLGPSDALASNIQNMSGFTSNPMNQAQASKVALYSIADYTWNSADYDSESSWHRGLSSIITDDEKASNAFQLFAQNCSSPSMSFPQTDESVYMKEDIQKFEARFLTGQDCTNEAAVLKEHFTDLIQAIDILKNYKGTNHISDEIKPWMEVTNKIADAGYYVLNELDSISNVNKNDDESIQKAISVIKEGRKRLYSSNGGKKASQKVLYPFVEDLLNNLEADIYKTLQIDHPYAGFGTSKADYTLAFDGKDFTGASLGSYKNDDYFGVNLGKATTVKQISLNMNEQKNNKKGYYKKGVLEYSLDKQNWTAIGEYETANIEVTDVNVTARFIRYRALDMWENEMTGENLSDIQLNEFCVNAGIDYQLYTDLDDTHDIQLHKTNNEIKLNTSDIQTLAPQNYIGVQFQNLKNVQYVSCDNEAVILQSSTDGIHWEEQSFQQLKLFQAKYIRILNDSQESIAFHNIETTIQLAGNTNLKASLSDSMMHGDIYSGNANNLVDGNESTTLWLKRGSDTAEERYIQLEMNDITPLHDLQVVYKGDNKNGVRIDISNDGENWNRIYETDTINSLVHKVTFNGESAKYMRYVIAKGEWSQIAEMYVNRSMDENASIISGDLDNPKALHDGDILNAIEAGNKAGSIIYDCVNQMAPEHFIVLKDPTSTVKLEAYIANTWITLPDLQNMYNDIQMQEYGHASAFRLSWDANTNPAFYELWSIGELAKEDTALAKLILKESINKAASAMNTDDFQSLSPIVQELIKSAYQQAVYVSNNPFAANSACMEAWFQLANALHYLDFIANKDVLSQLIETCKEIEEDEYTEESIAVLHTALDKAIAVFEDDYVLQETIDQAYDELSQALHALVKKDVVDKSTLQYIVEMIKKQIEDDSLYQKDEKWDIFKAVLSKAEDILVDKDVSQIDINTAIAQLAAAYENIRLIPSEEQLSYLKQFIFMIDHLNRSLFTDEELATIDETYAKASELISKFNPTRYEQIEKQMADIVKMMNSKQSNTEEAVILEQRNHDVTQMNKKPLTGDEAQFTRLLMLCLISAAGLIVVRKKA